jgi:hypothetical protein
MTNSVLSQASHQWASRPADESFLTLQSLHNAVDARTYRAKEFPDTHYSDLRVVADGDDIRLVGKSNIPSALTHWSFGQLCQRVKTPADFMRDLPATLATNVLNNRIANRAKDLDDAKLLLDINGRATVRAITGPDYARIWDRDITSRLLQLPEAWQPAPETDLASGGKTQGLYASDHDIFAFLVDNDRRVFESAPGGGLSRGFMIANSEVGDKSFWMMTFLYSYICGNHNVWGVDGVRELRIRHSGYADERAFYNLSVELRRYADASASDDEAKIRRCMAHQIADTKDELLDKLFGLKSLKLTRKTLDQAYLLAEQHEDWYGSPLSAWGIGNGISEAAKAIPYADQRVEVERSAGRVFGMAF